MSLWSEVKHKAVLKLVVEELVSVETWPQTIHFNFDELESQLGAGSYCPASVPDLTDVFGPIWGKIPAARFLNFVESLPGRMNGVPYIYTRGFGMVSSKVSDVIFRCLHTIGHVAYVYTIWWNMLKLILLPSFGFIYLIPILWKCPLLNKSEKRHEWHDASQPSHLFSPLLLIFAQSCTKTNTPKAPASHWNTLLENTQTQLCG